MKTKHGFFLGDIMKKIYLAGKISKNDWRQTFFKDSWDLRNTEPPVDSHGSDLIAYPESKEDLIFTVCGDQYTGPYFMSCDHGCYHGPSTHAMAGVGCGYDDGWERKYIVSACEMWIDYADIIFAWINSKDCFGTLAEIGYAHAKQKEIWIVYSQDIFGLNLEWPTNIIPKKHDMWFIDQMADKVAIAQDPLLVYKKWSDR